MRPFPLAIGVAALATAIVSAEDWPQFRGPTGQGHSTETGLPLEWGENTNVIWKIPVPGRGWSSPAVANGRVWMTTAVDDRGGSLRLLSVDVATGKLLTDTEVFRFRGGPAPNVKNSHASPTPIVDGDRVYVHFGANGTAAVSADGKVLWKIVLSYQSQHGNGGSPTLFEDLLIVNCDGGDQAFVAAVDTRTGRIRWQTPRHQPFAQAYTTPLVIRAAGRDQLVSVGAYRAVAYDPRSGREIWRVRYGSGFSNVPRPVFGEGLVFIATGFQQPTLIAVRPDGTGDVTNSHVAWTLTRGAPYTPSPLLVGGELFVVSDIGIATCLDAKTGAVHWVQRLGGNYSASPIFADGRIYFLNEEGTATVVAPGRAFRVLARNALDGATLASIAVSNGSFYIRSDTHLYRIGVPTATGGRAS
jgi:outer membrane protein assembly factor BamB